MKLIISFLCFMVAGVFTPNPSLAGPVKADPISFYRVPLVCNAAPFGCGSRSKPVLLSLQENESVKEAWLNRTGTVIAVVWQENTPSETQLSITEDVFTAHKVNAEALTGEVFDAEFASFSTRENWYKGSDVDQLTKEESAMIAEQVIKMIQEEVDIPSDKVEAMQKEAAGYIEKSLLGITSADQLNQGLYAQWQEALFSLGEKYLGEGNMPEIQLYGPKPNNETEEKACCTSKSSSSSSKPSCCSSSKIQ